ncbi:Alcohol dehydrogenase, zinc-binding domain protein [Acidothermus cellulolyticus 11B]|jgi:NADPH2:quinone reductase|uniref:Alcohol dehydrogenase, zinc-binding domain protein n=1 Tax=Acidothermus cellulolyticus (strain ATCC 43068 / DSM 8971 / 11B) TaxID=351607 RepID=A0LR99_ACIC1|nr:zinc-binding alcohol dehydrogenase family protein [Acidothermus cellulolyticus]ABK51959.1 Alcohol dehydrogenase, zinc-binding domain protein [Acidothermus cellulolyticus 11B]
MKTRAARLIRHGEPLVVETVELPEPGGDEVCVELAFAGVNPVDSYIIAGRVAPDAPLPRIVGIEASGYLDGRPVLVYGEGFGRDRDGGYARHAVVPRSAVHPLPEGIDLAVAACIGVAGATAWRVVEMAGVGNEDRVLVLGGAGGVGLPVISYARSKGARVWAQTSNPEKVDAMHRAGAEKGVVADAAALAAAIADFAPTVVFDPLGGSFTGIAIRALQPRGRLVIYGTSAGPDAEIPLQVLYRNNLRMLGYGGLIASPEELREAVTAAIAAVAAGRMHIPVGARVALDQINEAFALLRRRSIPGKIVVDLRD